MASLNSPDKKGRTIVVGIDLSQISKTAFQWVLKNIYREGDTLVLTHCPELPSLPSFTFKSGLAPPVADWKVKLDEMNLEIRKLEEEYQTICIQQKINFKAAGQSMKNAGEGILKVASDEGADMICVGTRGLGTVKRALLGSVSNYLVHNSTLIPVLVIPISG
ncbi:hypothetical protein LSAT2_020234 [Lamellibrachia satsuma]|nr:hypothetical protein LSAT2_020234 [Lamellibrachia satsuma]